MKFDEAPLAACSAGKAAVEVTTGSQRSRRKAQSLSQSLSLRMIRAARRMRKRNISADDPADADRNILKVALSEAVRVCVCVCASVCVPATVNGEHLIHEAHRICGICVQGFPYAAGVDGRRRLVQGFVARDHPRSHPGCHGRKQG